VKRVDREAIINRFREIEQRIEQLIDNCKRLEDENAQLKGELQQLTLSLQEKESAVRQHDELKDLVRTKIESLMGRLDKLSEE
jgi:cell division septum initiation protein DivIVA